jgi:hypothetical protein
MAETKQETGRSTKKGAFFRPAAMILAASLAITVLTAGLTGCEDPASGSHVHDWSEWVQFGEQYATFFDTNPPNPATYVTAGLMIEKILQDERRECRNDGTVEIRTLTIREGTKEMPAGYRIVDGVLTLLPTPSWPVMATPIKNIDVVSTIGLRNIEGTSISGVNHAEAVGIIGDVLGGMKMQAVDLKNWFDAASEISPTNTEQFRELMGEEAMIISAISGGSVTPLAFNVNIDSMLIRIFGGTAQGLEDIAVFKKYFDAYAKGQYLGARDWQTEPTALTAANDEFTSLIETARAQAAAEFTFGYGIRPLNQNWNNGRNNIITNYDSNGPQGDVFKNDLMGIMKRKITDALDLPGYTNDYNMAEALIIQIGQDYEEFRALIDDFQKATELHQSSTVGWDYDLTNALYGTYSIAQAQPQSSTHLARIDPQKQFQPDAIKTADGKPYEQFPLDAVKPGEYTGNFIPRKDERAV